MKQRKYPKKVSLHRRLSIYNFVTAIVPVFLAICITLTFMFSLIQMIYSGDNGAAPAVTNSRDIITVYFCQFNIRSIEKGFNNGKPDKPTYRMSKAYKRLESYGFSVCVKYDGEVMYISEGSDEDYFDDLNIDTYQYKDGLVFLDNNTMQIRDVSTNRLDAKTSVTLKSTGKPTEKRTSVALNLWQFTDTTFFVLFLTIVLFAIIFDIILVRRMTKSVLVPDRKSVV